MCKHFKYGFRKKGETICIAGTKDDNFCIILRGKVALSVPRNFALNNRKISECFKNEIMKKQSSADLKQGDATFLTD